MTSPNEWWKEEPYCEYKGNECCGWNDFHFNVPLIIEEVKRMESTTVKNMGRGELFGRWFRCSSCDSDEIIEDAVFCSHCGLKINWE
jgi:hypothetical protein